jgi:CheY-like chemotaxis protein
MRKRILVVEDDPDIRSALCTILEEEGYTVMSASDGREALAKLRDRNGLPGVILLDLMMPVMNGAEFRLAQLRDPRLRQIPVVVLSADGRYAETARALGAAAAFAKPFELRPLLDTLGEVAGAA